MKRLLEMRIAFAIATAGLMLPAGAAQAATVSLAGIWSGTLEAGVELRLALRVKTLAGGGWSATLESVDQGVTLPVDGILLDGATVAFEVRQVGGRFRGVINTGGSEISGEWSQMGARLPLLLKRTATAPAMIRPQEPKPPFPYDAREVSYANSAAGVKISGTLTLPRSGGPFPALLLITGSGPQDRNETIAGHKPFLVIGDHLTRHGIAVLRVDDRGVGGTSGSTAQATLEDLAGDVRAGIDYLKRQPEVDRARIGLLGHSEGGAVAAMVASASKDAAFVVLLAAPGVLGEQLLYAQGEAVARALGSGEPVIARQRALQQRLFALVKQGGDRNTLRARLQQVINQADEPAHERDAEGEHSQHELALRRIAGSQLDMLLAPGFRYFLTYDPRVALQSVKCPVLVLNGSKDTQVPAWQNLPAIEAALKAGGNSRHRVEEIAGVNHLFQSAKTGSVIEYAQISETIFPPVLDLVREWILGIVKKH